MKFGFVGPSYTGRAKNADAERTINLYLENVESPEAKVQQILVGAPGMKHGAYLPGLAQGSVGRGLFREPSTQQVYAVVGQTLAQIYVGNGAFAGQPQFGQSFQYGNVAATSPVSICSNGSQLVWNDGTNGYVFNFNNALPNFYNVLQINLKNFPQTSTTAPGASGFPGATLFDFLDGYLIALPPNSQSFYISLIDDATDWDALQFASKSSWPDQIVAMKVNKRLLWLLGSERGEVWWDSGNPDFPLERIQGASFEVGCVAPFSLQRLDGDLFWLGGDEKGQGVVYRSQGYQPVRISNHALEYQIQSYGTISDAEAWTEQREGHLFYWLYFPTGDHTWVYDVSTSQWHERLYWDSVGGTGWHAHHSRGHAYSAGTHITLDRTNTNVYAMDSGTYTDQAGGNGSNPVPLRWLRSCPAGFNERKWQYFNQLGIYFQPGQGLATGQGSNPLCQLRISDDGGNSWPYTTVAPMGNQGDFTFPTIFRGLGRSMDRAFELSGTEPIPTAILEAFLQ